MHEFIFYSQALFLETLLDVLTPDQTLMYMNYLFLPLDKTLRFRFKFQIHCMAETVSCHCRMSMWQEFPLIWPLESLSIDIHLQRHPALWTMFTDMLNSDGLVYICECVCQFKHISICIYSVNILF